MQKLISDYFNIDINDKTYIVERTAFRAAKEKEIEDIRTFLSTKKVTLQQLYDGLLRRHGGNGDYPLVSYKQLLAIKGCIAAPLVSLPLTPAETVHGPFDKKVYDDPEFVARYTEVRFETRVSEITRVLQASECTSIIAVGDGAGVCLEACERLGNLGKKIACESFDASPLMCELAEKMGRDVQCKAISDLVSEGLRSEVTYVLSHVTDYMAIDDLEAFSRVKTIIYGRAIEFPMCGLFRPYDYKWGYQLCTSNCRLAGFMPAVPLRLAGQLDYTVFYHPLVAQDREIAISDTLPLYSQFAVSSNIEVSETAHYAITQNPWNERGACGVPRVGPIGGGEGHSKFVVPPQQTLGFFTSNNMPIFAMPLYVGREFFCEAERVIINTGYNRIVLKPTNIGGVDFYHSYSPGIIEIERCKCYGKFPHSHMLQVRNNSHVELLNLVVESKRRYVGHVTRDKLFTVYSDCVGGEEVALNRFMSMERAMKAVYNDVGFVEAEG